MAQHLDSIYVTHYFSFAKNTDPVPRIFVQEGTTEAKKLVFCDCMSNLRYKDEDCMKDVTHTSKNSTPTLWFSGRLWPGKGYQTHDLRC